MSEVLYGYSNASHLDWEKARDEAMREALARHNAMIYRKLNPLCSTCKKSTDGIRSCDCKGDWVSMKMVANGTKADGTFEYVESITCEKYEEKK